MAVALLDTNVLFASASARDEYHERGRDIITGIDHGELPEAVVTNYVLAETLNLAREKLGPERAIGLLDRLISGAHFDIGHATRSDFSAGQAIFRQYPELSFVDATTAAYMHRETIEHMYSFDSGFDGVDGLTRLATPDNPFGDSP